MINIRQHGLPGEPLEAWNTMADLDGMALPLSEFEVPLGVGKQLNITITLKLGALDCEAVWTAEEVQATVLRHNGWCRRLGLLPAPMPTGAVRVRVARGAGGHMGLYSLGGAMLQYTTGGAVRGHFGEGLISLQLTWQEPPRTQVARALAAWAARIRSDWALLGLCPAVEAADLVPPTPCAWGVAPVPLARLGAG